MINPSSSGWIKKFFESQKIQRISVEYDSFLVYKKIRSSGLIYGHPVIFDNISDVDTSKWTIPEFTKVTLLVTLFNVYQFHTNQISFESFVVNAVLFYKKMTPDSIGFLKKILPESTTFQNLEDAIEDRVQTNSSVLTRNFSHILTNSLLFEDVLAYQQHLLNGDIAPNYIKNLEDIIIAVVSLCINNKETKSDYSELLIKFFESSFRYSKFSKTDNQNLENIDIKYITSNLERYYLLDLAVLSMWSETQISTNEINFLYEISKKLGVHKSFVVESINETNSFLINNKSNIPFFQYANPVKHFYDHTVDKVKVLIDRNKLRLGKELVNNGELALLLSHSTHRNLDSDEKKKIKKQLLEICKTIPSLAVFLLPGGSLLLPILIKFIPKLLPDTFNENLSSD